LQLPVPAQDQFETLACVLDERTRRLVDAAEASAIGHGGAALVAAAMGLSRGTVMRGIAELRTASRPERSQRIRRKISSTTQHHPPRPKRTDHV
jgi:hypothetical protein